ncbi:MAG: YIP1 family protein [Cypionkella sp.]|nr:YIP1 family protein [Cypionkella sp.]
MLLTFVAQYPRLSRISLQDAAIPLAPQLLGLAYGLLLFLPVAYGLAALSHIVARGLGAKGGSWYGARLALFWSLVACAPLVLLQGLTFGIIGPGTQSFLVGIFALTAFVVFWALALVEVYSKGAPHGR